VSDTQLTAVIPAKLLKDPAPAQVIVVNGDWMGWADGDRRNLESNKLTFAVVGRTLSISSLSPATARAGSDEITITITGSGFQIYGNGSPYSSFAVWSSSVVETDLLTRYVSDTQLTAIIPANL
jgi:hypothetical protein